MTDTIENMGKRLERHLTRKIEGEKAKLGKMESDGSRTVPVAGTVNEVWALLDDDPSKPVTAIDLITSRKPRLPVLLRKNTSGRYVVSGVDEIEATIFLGEAAPSSNIGPLVGGAMNAQWESYQLKQGSIRALNGVDLQVYMEELPYGNTLLGNCNGSMATAIATITSGKKAWIVISVNPNTNVLSFTKSAEYSLPTALTKSIAAQTVVPVGNIKLWAYLCRSTTTYVPVQKQTPDTLFFVDLRAWLAVLDSVATLETTDNTQTTIASISVDELSLLTLTGTFSGVKSDYTAAISGTFVAGIIRASGGDATLVGVTVTSNEDSSGTPALTVDAHTGTQTARIRVTGIVAEDWNWQVKYSTMVT